MAKGVHLFPSRTQKLSPYTSKVLGWKRPGRIDSCRLEKYKVYQMVYLIFFYCYRVSIRPGYPEKASRRLVASRQAKAINVTASFRRICDRTGSIWSVHR